MNKILFDMDGTLYQFENGQYRGSKLEQQVEKNAQNLLQILEGSTDSTNSFEEIKKVYGEEFSVAYEEKFGLNKLDYFEKVWDINPEGFIKNDRGVLELFEYLKNNGFEIYIVSESPKIWIERVLVFLQINEIIDGLYSGQGDNRKSNGLLYKKISEEIGNGYYMIGDQIQSDIVMAKNNGFKGIYINTDGKKIEESDFNISNLETIKLII